MSEIGFLQPPELTPEAQRLFEADLTEVGFVMNATRLWGYQPATMTGLFDLLRQSVKAGRLDVRTRGILVASCASALGDSYCALAWGCKLADVTDARTASGVLRGTNEGLSASERTMASWARKVVRDPSGTGKADVQSLRDAGFDDTQIFAITVFVALRITFSTINDALGAHPDAAFRSMAPQAVLDAVNFGRPIAEQGSTVSTDYRDRCSCHP